MKRVWGIFWIIAAAIGGHALWDSWMLPSESRNAFLFGMSKSKLALCGGMAVLILICIFGAVTSLLRKENAFSSGKAAGIAAYCAGFGLILGQVFLLPPVGRTALERSLLERLTPLAYWAFAFLSLAFLFLFIKKGKALAKYMVSSPAALIFGVLFAGFSTAAFYYALRTGVGLDPISGTFYRQGVSLLEGHLILPLLFLYPLMPLFRSTGRKISGKWIEGFFHFLTAVLIFAAAVRFWQTAPFEGRSYFAPALRPPNYNYYPASDAESYDLLAQSILLGNGFRNGITVVRPLYAAFLALLHWIFGNDYIRLTNGQILLLALIPVLVFLIGKKLRHPAGGLIAAVWIIWREIYSIRLTSLVQVSNSRLLMSDLPSMLLVTAVILSAVRWHSTGRRSARALLCGGLIGAAMLLRTQCFVLIPVLWLLFLCSKEKASVKWRSLFVSILGIAVVFAPWIVWGKIAPNTTVNNDVSEGNYLLQLYRTAAGETDQEADLVQIIKKHPAETLQAAASHFLNNEIASVLVLPARLTKVTEADQLFYENDLFWYRENEREVIEKNLPLIAFYLLIITIGIISSRRKAGGAALAPILFHLAYNLGNALAMTSGFRFTLPVDWVFPFYFALGCAAVLDGFCRILLFSFAQPTTPGSMNATPRSRGSRWAFAGVFLFLLLIGAVLPFCDGAFPYRIPRKFEPVSSKLIRNEWERSSDGEGMDLSAYSGEELVFLEGRAFYPRIYNAGEGDSGGSSSAKRGLDFDRLVWMFHDTTVKVLACPLSEAQKLTLSTAPLPDPADIMVVGISRDDYIEVLEMRFLEEKYKGPCHAAPTNALPL